MGSITIARQTQNFCIKPGTLFLDSKKIIICKDYIFLILILNKKKFINEI